MGEYLNNLNSLTLFQIFQGRMWNPFPRIPCLEVRSKIRGKEKAGDGWTEELSNPFTFILVVRIESGKERAYRVLI